jgi:hypothetical protein
MKILLLLLLISMVCLTGCASVTADPAPVTVYVTQNQTVVVIHEVEIIREVEIPVIKTEYIEIKEEKSLPTLAQVKEFILSDNTSSKVYLNGIYECRHFATDVNNNAEIAGLKCAFVILCFRTYQHAVVAFETSDIGLIFIEPQSDAAIYPKVGEWYHDQEILEILICW